MEITPELAEKVLRGGPDAIAVVRGIYQSHVEKLDALESEARKIRDAAAMLPLVWIPVSQRLPQDDENVLVFDPACHGTHIAWCHKDSTGEIVWASQVYYGLKPTHWMPLPEPPPQ